MIVEQYLPIYQEKGFQPVVVHIGDQLAFACDLAREFGAALPILLDSDETLLNVYQQVGLTSTLFPLAYLIDGEEVVQKVYNDPEQENEETKSPLTLLDDLETLLGL